MSSNPLIWLKPVLKCLDKIIDCKKPKPISYLEIRTGNILSLKLKNSSRTYVATSTWDNNMDAGCFINLQGSQIVLSARVLRNLTISLLGSLEVKPG